MRMGRRPVPSMVILGGAGFAAGLRKARAAKARRSQEQARQADLPAALQELKGLADQGALTPEEFATAKRKLLDS